MSRRSKLQRHAIRGKSIRKHEYSTAPGTFYYGADSLCGEGHGSVDGDTAEHVIATNRKATCPKCSKKWGTAKLARAGGRVRLEPWAPSPEQLKTRGRTEDFKPFRSAWRCFVDDVERALIVNDFGFGTDWQITEIAEFEPRSYGRSGKTIGGSLSRHSYSWDGENQGVWPIHRASKEAAAFMCIDLAERGLLPTLAEQEAAAEIAKRERDEREAQRERERAEREAEREEIRKDMERKKAERAEWLETAKLALPDLESRADLSNLELAGLSAIRRLLEVTS